MPDHWHALNGLTQPLTISQVMHDVKKLSARKLNGQRRTSGPLWQHQFWDRFLRHQKELIERLEYMHRNPVRRGLVNRPEDWRWSSYLDFTPGAAVEASRPIQIDRVELPEEYRG
jgi:REP element-mobilizing transposase RayT